MSLALDSSDRDGTDRAYMARALDLAARGLNTTDPNPRVGCVLVRGGETLGELANPVVRLMRALPIPIIGRVARGALWLDLRTLDDEAAFAAQLEAMAA